MKVRLNEMKLENFKGIRDLKIIFDGLDTNIYGKNASGKTTIVDAFMWVFFNKDSSGSSDFDIKTRNAQGEHLHNLEHSVEVSLIVDNIETRFKKVFKEKYTKKRGAVTAEFTGHTTDYYVDDVPRKKKEFDDTVNQLFDASVFPMITDPFYFNEKMKWQDRRKMLIEMCGDIPDSAVISQNSELKPLESVIGTKSIDDYRLQLKSQMKPINDELKAIPIKINEAQRAIPESVENFDSDKYSFIEERITLLEKQKQQALNGGAVSEKEIELSKLKNQKLLLLDEIPNTRKLKEELYQLEFDENKLSRQIEEKKNAAEHNERIMNANENEREDLRNKFISIKSQDYSGETVCPTCGQELPVEKIQEAMEQFNLKKSEDLEKINNQGVDLKNKYEELSNKLKLIEIEREQLQAALEDNKKCIADKKQEIEDIEANFKQKQQPKLDALDEKIVACEREIDYLKSNVSFDKEDQLQQLKEEKAQLDSIQAQIILANNQRLRIRDLEKQEKELADEYSIKEQMLYLTDVFIKEKVAMLTQNINSHFEVCRFKLFNQNINGGIEECCEATYKGVNYSDLNNAMKINCGLDIIQTISTFKEMQCPIWIDNAESVNQLFDTTSQQIRLYVSEDETLTVMN